MLLGRIFPDTPILILLWTALAAGRKAKSCVTSRGLQARQKLQVDVVGCSSRVNVFLTAATTTYSGL